MKHLKEIFHKLKENFKNLKSKFTQDNFLLRKLTNRKVRFGIATFIIVIIIIALLTPQIPEITYRINPPDPEKKPEYPVSYVENEPPKYITDGNRLFIPKIAVDTKILEGDSEDIMGREEGTWRDPSSSTPETLGNMVLAGHRFQYLPPNTTTFYNLDKLEIGDKVNVYWEGKEYIYEIQEKFEVYPNEVWIKNHTGDSSEITLYTCTPIYTSEKRLVVKARIIEE